MNRFDQPFSPRRFLLAFLISAALAAPGLTRANPVDPVVTHGAATFDQVGGQLTINQLTDRAVIDWQSFSISADEITQFVQPGTTSAVLNRVRGNAASFIDGQLLANGRVFLLNSNGILIGPNGYIDTAGFVASTLDVDSDEFMRGGDLHFRGTSNASVVNLGTIKASAGDVVLIGANVRNSGTILAPRGTVALAGGQDVILMATGDSRIKVRTGKGVVINQGVIAANRAELEAHHGNVGALAIRNDGRIAATGVTKQGGRIYLSAGGKGKIKNTGTLKARVQPKVEAKPEIRIEADEVEAGGTIDASSETNAGGYIAVQAREVLVPSGTVVLADGETGGGQINIGGGLRGSDPELRNATEIPEEVVEEVIEEAINTVDATSDTETTETDTGTETGGMTTDTNIGSETNNFTQSETGDGAPAAEGAATPESLMGQGDGGEGAATPAGGGEGAQSAGTTEGGETGDGGGTGGGETPAEGGSEGDGSTTGDGEGGESMSEGDGGGETEGGESNASGEGESTPEGEGEGSMEGEGGEGESEGSSEGEGGEGEGNMESDSADGDGAQGEGTQGEGSGGDGTSTDGGAAAGTGEGGTVETDNSTDGVFPSAEAPTTPPETVTPPQSSEQNPVVSISGGIPKPETEAAMTQSTQPGVEMALDAAVGGEGQADIGSTDGGISIGTESVEPPAPVTTQALDQNTGYQAMSEFDQAFGGDGSFDVPPTSNSPAPMSFPAPPPSPQVASSIVNAVDPAAASNMARSFGFQGTVPVDPGAGATGVTPQDFMSNPATQQALENSTSPDAQQEMVDAMNSLLE